MTSLLIDARNLLSRTYFVCLNEKEANHHESYLMAVASYIRQFKADSVYVCWDKRAKYEETSFRKELCPDYKAGRSSEHKEALQAFQDAIIPVIDSLGWNNMFPYVSEADDVIAWLCHTLEDKKVIISTDQDFCQLINDDVIIYTPTKKEIVTLNNFESYYGVPQDKYLLYKAIMGDKSDNVKGLHRHGEVKAAKLANNFDENSISDEDLELITRNKKIMDLTIGYKQHPNEVKFLERQLVNIRQKDVVLFEKFCKILVMDNVYSNISRWKEDFFGETRKSIEDSNTKKEFLSKMGLI